MAVRVDAATSSADPELPEIDAISALGKVDGSPFDED